MLQPERVLARRDIFQCERSLLVGHVYPRVWGYVEPGRHRAVQDAADPERGLLRRERLGYRLASGDKDIQFILWKARSSRDAVIEPVAVVEPHGPAVLCRGEAWNEAHVFLVDSAGRAGLELRLWWSVLQGRDDPAETFRLRIDDQVVVVDCGAVPGRNLFRGRHNPGEPDDTLDLAGLVFAGSRARQEHTEANDDPLLRAHFRDSGERRGHSCRGLYLNASPRSTRAKLPVA